MWGIPCGLRFGPLHYYGLKGGTPKALKVLPLFFAFLSVCMFVDKLQTIPFDPGT